MSDFANGEQVAEQVIQLLSGICRRDVEGISMDQTLIFDLGIDSIQFLELFAELEETFHFELDMEDLQPERLHSVQALVRFVQERMSP
jgi:acyl carrier protein